MSQYDSRKIRNLLDEDVPDEADMLELVVGKMRQWEAPTGDPSRKAHLSAMLMQEHQAQKQAKRLKLGEWWPLLLIQSQLRVVEKHIWTASALVMALGSVVTLALDPGASTNGLPFALIAPLIAAAGIAFLYSPENESVMEIERGTAASIRLIWLARITLVFGFNALLGIGASVALSLFYPSVSAWSLVMMWLAPMALLSALAFVLSVRQGDPMVGIFVSLMLWLVQVMKHLIPQGVFLIDQIPNLLIVEVRLWTFALALLLLGIGLWMIGRMQPTRVES